MALFRFHSHIFVLNAMDLASPKDDHEDDGLSFQNGNFWMGKAVGYPEGEMAYDNSSRIQPKRPHQWFLDQTTEPELFPSKKLAIESSNSRPISGVPNVNLSWETPSSFHSVPNQVTDHQLFGAEPPRTINFGGRNFQSINAGHLDIGRRGIEDQFGNDASVALSMSHTMEDPGSCLSYGGIRKVKVNEVKDSEHGLPFPMSTQFNRGDHHTKDSDHGLPFPVSYPFNRGYNHTLSFSGFQEVPETNSMTGRLHSVKDSNNGMPFHPSKNSTNGMPFHTVKESNNGMPFHPVKESNNGMPFQMGNTFNRDNSNTISFSVFQEQPGMNLSSGRLGQVKQCSDGMTNQTFERGDSNNISFDAFQEEPGTNSLPGRLNHVKGSDSDNVMSLMGSTFSKVDSNTISLGGFPVEPEMNAPSGRLISNYDSVMRRSSVQPSEPSKEKEPAASNSAIVAIPVPVATAASETSKNKTEQKASKKLPPNNFPSNVRSLLSTCILDGVHVKYMSWSREKELAGMIKGSGYLCGCQSCQFSKVLNAYEFERHAGCKTKHPNNHIFFANGKTVYGIVQELRSTPQNMLFEAIKTVTGSPINEKAFHTWKASFEAATRELERIYGKDEMNPTSLKTPDVPLFR